MLPASIPPRLSRIYGPQADDAGAAIETAIADVAAELAGRVADPHARWTERDVVLITYADQLRADDQAPLATLNRWLRRERLDELINTVHLLPFCPYSSDDGFSVIDYLEVDPNSGDWSDVARLGENFDLMFDLVLNHCSQHSEWFQAYKRGEPPYDQFFIEADPSTDLSAVVRPRSLPLLTPVETASGEKHVWTTFSDDQIDLNYANPRVLAEMLRILLEYAKRGARIVRLDAVAFLWKKIGTNCLHLPQTHEIVKLCRDLLAEHAPRTLVLTETNVPHAENVSYFGAVDPAGGGGERVAEGEGVAEGDEAHMVYNFSLPPLLLDAFTSGDATAIRAWLENLEDPPPGCTYFNFTASHDGIGVRPLEGLVSDERFDRMIEAVRARGGKINTRRKPDGTDAPYELNITFVDALSPPPPVGGGAGGGGAPGTRLTAKAPGYPAPTPLPNPPHQGEGALVDLHARRFLTSQAIMLALRGMPAVYFHSLVGTRNDYAGVEQSGQNRRINRHKYALPELDAHLAAGDSLARRIYDGYRELLAVRINEPAFHPDAPQRVIDAANERVLAFERTSLDRSRRVLVFANFSTEPQGISQQEVSLAKHEDLRDARTDEPVDKSAPLTIEPGDFLYLVARDAGAAG